MSSGQSSQPDNKQPTSERQAELAAAYEANLDAGKDPYDGVQIRTAGEVRWILARRGWSGQESEYTVKYVLVPQGLGSERANFAGARLPDVNLKGLRLRRANLRRTNLVKANLSGVDLLDADLSHADLGYASFEGANLSWANLHEARLREVNLQRAQLRFADLTGARFARADLRGANLRDARMDASTVLSGVVLDARTRVRDVVWNGVALTRIAWERITKLGDEEDARRRPTRDRGRKAQTTAQTKAQRSEEGLAAYQGAVRTYQQLALALRSQGILDPAAHFAFRAQLLQRGVLRRQHKYGRLVFSWLLAMLSGYGYRLSRILLAYVVVLLLFAAAYFAGGQWFGGTNLAWYQALLVSLTAVHGRVFFEQFGLNSVQAWIAAVEAVVGLVIEGVFVAMLIQRFFAR
jgi:uncharacterized protein YjbI with pentapeptide repeats